MANGTESRLRTHTLPRGGPDSMPLRSMLGVFCLILFVVSDLSVGQQNERTPTGGDSDLDTGFQCRGKAKQSRPSTKINLGELTKKALRLPQPRYPQLAKDSGVSGPVTVEVVVSLNSGAVVWTQVLTGHPLLRAAVNDAACRARFAGTYDVDGYGSGRLTTRFVVVARTKYVVYRTRLKRVLVSRVRIRP